MTEDSLLLEVTTGCEGRGLLWHHCTDSRRCQGPRGFPDLFILGPGGFLLAELKGEDGETSADQDGWLWRLHDTGIPYAVWYPKHWRSGAIQTILDELAVP